MSWNGASDSEKWIRSVTTLMTARSPCLKPVPQQPHDRGGGVQHAEVSLVVHKCTGLTTRLTFLGIEIDLIESSPRLLEEKLQLLL